MDHPFSLMASGNDVVDGATVASLPQADHSDTGPSQAKRVLRCPGSVAAIRAWTTAHGVPSTDGDQDYEDDSARSRGAKLHDCLAKALRTAKKATDPIPKDMDAIPGAAHSIPFCFNRFHNVLEQYRSAHGDKVLTLIEERLPMLSSGAQFGTVDAAIVVPGITAVVLDWKFGDRPIDAPRQNWQGILYGHAMVENFGVRNVLTVFVRPAATPPWDDQEHQWSAEELNALAMTYRQAVDLALQPDAPLCCGDHCAFCPIKDVCTARHACLLTVPTMATLPSFVATLTRQERRRLWDRAGIALGLLNRIRTVLEEEALADRAPIDGAAVVMKDGRRMWADPAIAAPVLEGLMQAAGKARDAAWVRELISPAQAEKALGKRADVRNAMEPLITRGPAEPKLVVRS